MTIEEILKLGEMGYTKEDIEKMSAPEQKTEPKKPDPAMEQKQEPEKEPDPATEQKQEPEKKPDPATEQKPDDYYSKISSQMEKLLTAIQKANIENDNQPKPITAEEALAAIINPPEVKK